LEFAVNGGAAYRMSIKRIHFGNVFCIFISEILIQITPESASVVKSRVYGQSVVPKVASIERIADHSPLLRAICTRKWSSVCRTEL